MTHSFTRSPVIDFMMNLHMCTCLLLSLSFVKMEALNISGRVGNNLSFTCSTWNVYWDVKEYAKYLCKSPCTKNKHIITTAEYKRTNIKNRIEITNTGGNLYVTFINLQKSDAGKYHCGVQTYGTDPLIEVNIRVLDAVPPSPGKTPTTVSFPASPGKTSTTVSVPASPDPVTFSTGFNVSTVVSVTNKTFSITTPAALSPHGEGSVTYLIVGVTVSLTLLMALLLLMRKTNVKRQKVVSGHHAPQGDALEDVEYDEIRPEDHQSQPNIFSTVYVSVDPNNSVYANTTYLPDPECVGQGDSIYSNDAPISPASCSRISPRRGRTGRRVPDLHADFFYSVVQFPKKQPNAAGQPKVDQSKSDEDDFVYSLAQLPQTT